MQNAFLSLYRREFRTQDLPFSRPDAAPRFHSECASGYQDPITKALSQAVSRSNIALDTMSFCITQYLFSGKKLKEEKINESEQN